MNDRKDANDSQEAFARQRWYFPGAASCKMEDNAKETKAG
jgi:hypothetical protein